MVFSSVSFLVYFLPVLLGTYYIVPKRARKVRNLTLLFASIVFYAWGGISFLPILLASIAVNYICGIFAAQENAVIRKFGVVAAAVIGIGMLGWYKYAGFFARTFNMLGAEIPVPDIILPIGISFYTFQGLSYVVDVYRRKAPVQYNPLNVALYVALFPQLVAGPIVRYDTVALEITERNETIDDFASGLVRFSIGLAKKMVIANLMGEAADEIFAMDAASMPALLAWMGAAFYTMQIYFDFSAYSDMAIGLGRLFGFHFSENFNYPYTAVSVTDFWRRWHISLSTWFRDYVYIPLGGSRAGKAKELRNLAVVWLLTGLWHGANFTFIIWGAWFLVLLMGEKFIWGNALKRLPSIIGRIYTLLAVIFGWVLFRSDTVTSALQFIGAMFGAGGAFMSPECTYYARTYIIIFIAALIGCLPVKDALSLRMSDKTESVLSKIWALVLLGVSYVMLVTGSFNPFIYFQF